MIDPRLEYVRKKTKRRLLFSAIHLVLYFSFTLNWTAVGSVLASTLGGGPMTGSILMFVVLVLLFLAMESVFLRFDREDQKA